MRTRENELTREAYDKGFHGIAPRIHVYHLWLADLQKWLREEHKAIVDVTFTDCFDEWYARVYLEDIMSPMFEASQTNPHETYEDALEEGLTHAVKHIKKLDKK